MPSFARVIGCEDGAGSLFFPLFEGLFQNEHTGMERIKERK
jgi:hypothetical protein